MSDIIAPKLPCQPCRTSRTRCDRLSPTCTRCQTRGLGSTCRYVTTLPHGRTRQSHVRSQHRPCEGCKKRHVRCHHPQQQQQQQQQHGSRSGSSSGGGVDTARDPRNHQLVGITVDGNNPFGDGRARAGVTYSGPRNRRLEHGDNDNDNENETSPFRPFDNVNVAVHGSSTPETAASASASAVEEDRNHPDPSLNLSIGAGIGMHDKNNNNVNWFDEIMMRGILPTGGDPTFKGASSSANGRGTMDMSMSTNMNKDKDMGTIKFRQTPTQGTGTVPIATIALASASASASEEEPRSILYRSVNELEPFFESVEQLHHFKHFTHQTSLGLISTPCPPHLNPWLTDFAQLALVHPHGTSALADTLRVAISSLVSVDIGSRLQSSFGPKDAGGTCSDRQHQHQHQHQHHHHCNAVLELAAVQRKRALRALDKTKCLPTDSLDLTLFIGACLALSTRDRLAGDDDWESVLHPARRTIAQAGGPAICTMDRTDRYRTFVIEQIACTDMLCTDFTHQQSGIVTQDSSWLKRAKLADGKQHDDVELIWGMSRPVMTLYHDNIRVWSLKRDLMHLEALRRASVTLTTLETAIYDDTRRAMKIAAEGLLGKIARMRQETQVSQNLPRVTLGNMAFLATYETVIHAEILGNWHIAEIQHSVDAIMELITEAMSMGMFIGLLVPLVWAALLCFDRKRRQRSLRILLLLEPYHHCEMKIVIHIVETIWALIDKDMDEAIIVLAGSGETYLRRIGGWIQMF
ncbi:hypothetical protein FFLO_03697 [Filobasidium floriforme]|uniref:Zn(2)-C6 fungal-type domain-containing protein n=1 Tax=Filobasidium floriforme TaxID=5210 RepID=A0A8K0JLP2_9TREE|nr:fungal-specific transcription factor domain-containing protein [Filobasidium floriforme]KAG7532229.1 hypothetical protein FFLO_03697 [Filobasidium floriforme]KAH8077852.1 fungal-specific transcription factor domain-containing protein [Filobasidium floriforme]